MYIILLLLKDPFPNRFSHNFVDSFGTLKSILFFYWRNTTVYCVCVLRLIKNPPSLKSKRVLFKSDLLLHLWACIFAAQYGDAAPLFTSNVSWLFHHLRSLQRWCDFNWLKCSFIFCLTEIFLMRCSQYFCDYFQLEPSFLWQWQTQWFFWLRVELGSIDKLDHLRNIDNVVACDVLPDFSLRAILLVHYQ